MEDQLKKCSLKSHNKFNATVNCLTCKLYMCEKCLIKNINNSSFRIIWGS